MLRVLAHPGGNLTGLFLDAPTLCGKWLQQIGDIVPNMSKVATLWDATTGTYQLDAIKAAVKARSIDLVVMEFRDNDGLEAALKSGLAQGPQAVIQLGSPLTRQAGARTAEILSARRIPGISQFRTFPDGGGLMSYGPDLIQLYRRTGAFVSKNSSRRSPCRFADRTAHQVRTGHQHEDCQGAWHRGADFDANARRRGDRMSGLCARQCCTCSRPEMALTVDFPRCSDTAAIEGSPDGMRTCKQPPSMTQSGHPAGCVIDLKQPVAKG